MATKYLLPLLGAFFLQPCYRDQCADDCPNDCPDDCPDDWPEDWPEDCPEDCPEDGPDQRVSAQLLKKNLPVSLKQWSSGISY
ncbi:MAG: hypothetical protein ACUVQK_14790, partial [Thermogutta sp.]